MLARPATTSSPAVIGPNALIQTVTALREQMGHAAADALLRRGGQGDLIHSPPSQMVDEQRFADLVRMLAEQTDLPFAHDILERAGQLTAAYLLRHRIPKPFQRLLYLLPRRLALRLLLLTIRRHAWTFVGSGAFTYRLGRTPQLTVASRIEPVSAACGFYGGTFTHLLRSLIDPRVQVRSSIVAVDSSAESLARCEYFIIW